MRVNKEELAQIIKEEIQLALNEQTVAADPHAALIEKYWGIVTGKQMKPSREELLQLQQIAKKSGPAAKILAQYFKPINRNMYSYWRKHYEKLSGTSLGRGKMHAVAKRVDSTFAHPEMKKAIIDGLDKGLTVAAIIAIATGIGAPAGVALGAAAKAALRQGFKQAVKVGGRAAAEQGLKKAAIHTAQHVGKEKATWAATKRAVS